jgi:alpha-D-ribose 1-methylphosphonate 5-triphosphate diphosphatase PhnM
MQATVMYHEGERHRATPHDWWHARAHAWQHEEVADALERVLEARKRYEQAQVDARDLVDRARAALGLEIHLARQDDATQTRIVEGMKKSRQQVRTFELAWERWEEKHPGQDPREVPSSRP